MEKLTPNQQLALIAKLQSENEALKNAQAAQAAQKLTLKVSPKGAVSVYGLGRFPVTLYSEQWAKLLGEAKAITAFIEVNTAKLSTKADKAKREAEAAGVVTVAAK